MTPISIKKAICLLSLIVFLCLKVDAQCPCQDCPVFVPDVGTESSCIDISGLTNSTINSGGQLICEISLNFEHTWIGDINIALIAPDGSSIDLVWEGAFGGNTGEFWDVTFLPCADAPLPDPGMPDVFPSQGWPNDGPFTGSYFPGNGCFEDFTGPANGSWCIEVVDNISGDVTNLNNWSITFCDEDGLECGVVSSCAAEGGTTSVSEDIYCEGDPDLALSITVSDENTDPDYAYTFAISDITSTVGPILSYSDSPDLSSFGPGVYSICGLSYLFADEALITPADGSNTTTELSNDIDASIFCGDLNEFCINITIIEEPTINFDGPTEVCAGTEYIYTITDWDPALGTYGSNINMGGFDQFIPLGNGQYAIIWNDAIATGEICANLTSACGFIDDCLTVNVGAELQPLDLVYQTTVCIDDVNTITWNEVPGNSYSAFVNTGNLNQFTFAPGTVTYAAISDDPVEICVEETSDCGSLVTCANITVSGPVLTNETVVDTCAPDFDLLVFGDGVPISGTWTQISGPSTAFLLTPNSSVTEAEAAELGIYTFQFSADCGGTVDVTIELTQDLDSPDITFECQGDGGYIVTITMTPGLGPYNVNGEIVTSNVFVSEVLFANTSFFVMGAEQACRAWIDSVTPDCPGCTTSAGTISSDLLTSCEGDDLTVSTNGDEVFDSNDNGIYIVHTDENDPLGSMLLESMSGDISFTPPMVYGTTYYVSYVVGNGVGNSVDLSDPCLDIASSTPVQFFEPINFMGIQVDPVGNCGDMFELVADHDYSLSGTWFSNDTPPGGSAAFDPPQGDITTVTFSEPGTYIVSFLISNGPCTITPTVPIESTGQPEIISLVETCLDPNEYEVSFEIINGTPPYFVNGNPISGSTFVSTPIFSGSLYSFQVEDSNGCLSDLVTGTQDCSCISESGTLPSNILELCDDQVAIVITNGNEIFDGDDNGVFILHDSPTDVLGVIFEENTTGIFSYNNTLSLGVTYYISYVVGNSLANSVDFNDPCLSVSLGQPVIFFETPVIFDITVDPEVSCGPDFNLEAVTNTNIDGVWTTISSPVGGVVVLSNVLGDQSMATVNVEGTYVMQYQIDNGPCTAREQISFTNDTDALALENISYQCQPDGSAYQVTFEIIGGSEPYTINGVTINGSTFTSDLIPTGDSQDFEVIDVNGCTTPIFVSEFDCPSTGCSSDAGTMVSSTIELCEDDFITIIGNGDENLDNDDNGIFILHDSPTNVIGFIYEENTTGIFSYINGLTYGVTYYVSLVVGDGLGVSVDLNDPCLSVALGQPIVFFESPLITSITVGEEVSCDPTFLLDATTTSFTDGLWTALSTPVGATVLIANDMASQTSVTVDEPGSYIINFQLVDGVCQVNEQLSFTYNPVSLSLENVAFECDTLGELYDVTFNIAGGEEPYSVNGIAILGSAFTSNFIASGSSQDFIVQDVNGCEAPLLTSDFDCPSPGCISNAGTIITDDLIICDTLETFQVDLVEYVLDNNDTSYYIIYTDIDDPIGSVVELSSDGLISFSAAYELDSTYYISHVVGDLALGTIDILDECLSFSNVMSFVYEDCSCVTTLSLSGSTNICGPGTVLVTVLALGNVPVDITISNGLGNELSISVTQVGESMFSLPVETSGVFNIVNTLSPDNCNVDFDGQFEVEVEDKISIELVDSTMICNTVLGGSVLDVSDLLVTQNVSGEWSDEDGNVISSELDFDGQLPGNYAYTFTTLVGGICPDTSSTVTVIVEDCSCPTDIFNTSLELCEGEVTIVLESLFEDSIYVGNWQVSSASGMPLPSIENDQLIVSEGFTGDINLTFSIDNLPMSCPSEYMYSIRVFERPSSGNVVLDELEICQGELDQIILFDFIEDYDENGTWLSSSSLLLNPESGAVNVQNADGGLYTFQYVVPANGPCSMDVVEVTVIINNPEDIFLNLSDPICFGQSDGSVTVLDENDDIITNFTIENSDNVSVNPDSLRGGEYVITVTDDNGCITVEDFSLVDPLELLLDLGDDVEVQEGALTTITPVINLPNEEISLYQWFINQSSQDLIGFDTLILAPEGESLIQLVITDEDGCIIADDLLITILENEVPVVIANIFNPKNGNFGLEDFEDIELVNQFNIYDRWGQLIHAEQNFDPSDNSKKWNGTYAGSSVMSGVYVYSIVYTDKSGELIPLVGDVTLLGD